MKRFLWAMVVLYALGITGAALLNRWDVWPESDWQPGPPREDDRGWLRGQPPPQPITPEYTLSVE